MQLFEYIILCKQIIAPMLFNAFVNVLRHKIYVYKRYGALYICGTVPLFHLYHKILACRPEQLRIADAQNILLVVVGLQRV